MKEKKLEQIEWANETANNKIKWMDKSKQEYRDYLKSLLESHKGLTTAEKLLKMQPFVQELEKNTWQELKSRLWFWWPNNRVDDGWWWDYEIDNPHRYWFADIDWLYNPMIDDGVYFRIDILQWNEDESRYIRCNPTLTIDNIKITLNLKDTQDVLLDNAKAYNRLLKDRLSSEEFRTIHEHRAYGWKTVWDEKLQKYVANKNFTQKKYFNKTFWQWMPTHEHIKKRQSNRRPRRSIKNSEN